nr:carboxypeptidase regulatory-like domain-containing protein [Blastocatellia bacterium]
MKQYALCFAVMAVFLLTAGQSSIFAQTAGSIGGSVSDANGAAVPNATVVIKSAGGQEFTVTTNVNGGYQVPSLGAGFYVVTTTAPNFKRSVVENVKVDVGVPATVNVTLETGEVTETVVVTGGAEILQTQTATIGTTITGRQIIESPIPSRDALDLVGMLPGTATVGAPRRSSINGLPKGSLSITIDGVDVQDNLLRSSDGYFTYVRPRVDAIEEVTVTSSNPGAEGGGDGAVQIKFVTRRGNNNYRGSAFWQHRNEALNANYWYLNRDGERDDRGKAIRQKIRLNQYGANFSGPIPFLNFGEGGPLFNSGKSKRFFFVNYEEFRLPQTQSRSRTIFTPEAQAGIYRYIVGSETRERNLFDIALAANQLGTPDPTIAAMLARIRTAVGTQGTVTPITGSPNFQTYNFSPAGNSVRKFLALRLDFNLTKNHSLEFVTNQQEFVPSKDFLNSQDERFPGFPSYTQGSERTSYAIALRSTLRSNLTNEARYTLSTGLSTFSEGISVADFAYTGGFLLDISAAGATTPYSRNSSSNRNTPTFDFTDNVTWILGNHSIGFGGQWKLIRREGSAIGRIAPTISFGLLAADAAAFNMFSATTLPGASPAQLTAARNLYAVLVGRVTGYTSTAYLSADGTYRENSELSRLAKQNTYGLYLQDSWRARPNLTLNFGLRWQPQTAFTALSEGVYSRLESHDQIFGVSGAGNLFKPGTLTGSAPRVVPLAVGEKAYPDDLNNFAPSVGFVWSPDSKNGGFLRHLLGRSGKSVFRGGYSMSFVREGFNLLESLYGANPGGSQSLTRNSGAGNLVVGTNLRDPNNPNLRPATFDNNPATPIVGSRPNFPIALTASNSTNSFDPNLKTGKVHSFSFGYQRELDKNTVIEFRYVGNRGVDLQRQYNINEFNTIENGFANEFVLAQSNLYANIAAGRGNTFAYFGEGTGTSQLPIMMAYFNTAATFDPANPARYTAGNFANTTLVNALSRNAPNIFAFSGTSFENSAVRRSNAIANGLPVNFFYVNPTTGVSGSYTVDNSNRTWYDSGVIELRRRLTNGLRIGSSYVFSKAQANAYASSSELFAGFSQRENGLNLAKNVQAFDIRHQFKFDATYDLPFGRGRQFLSGTNTFVNSLVGGWSILPTVRWQSGSPFSLGNVQLVGMTKKQLQKEIGVYKNTILRDGTQRVTYLPLDIIENTQRAFNINVSDTLNNGYG